MAQVLPASLDSFFAMANHAEILADVNLDLTFPKKYTIYCSALVLNQGVTMEFRVGDKVVYPNQGVGIVEQISSRNLTGRPETFYLLKISGKGLRVIVPMTNVASVGLRRVAKGREVGSVLEYLSTVNIGLQQDWKGRFKQNLEKMRTGSLQNVAEVFKALLTLSQEKPLSFREKRMFDRAWQLLVDEIAEVRGITHESVEAELVKGLNRSNLKIALPS